MPCSRLQENGGSQKVSIVVPSGGDYESGAAETRASGSRASSASEAHLRSSRHSIAEMLEEAKGKKMGWIACAFFCFISTSGGPFGLEALVAGGGPLIAISVLVAIPILFSVPLILMIEEISSWMPSSHGAIRWVTRALGQRVGYLNAFLQIVMNIVDLSVYPVISQEYLFRGFAPHLMDEFWPKFGVRLAVIFICSIPAILPIKALEPISAALFVIIIAPFIVGFVYGLPKVDPAILRQTTENIDIAIIPSIGLFMYTGVLPKGTISADVEKRGLLKGLLVAIFLDCFIYVAPLVVATRVDTNWANWGDGYLVTAMNGVLNGLGPASSVAGFFSGVALYAGAIVCYSRSVWAIADLGWFPRSFTSLNRYGQPYYGTILHVVLAIILNTMDFQFLVKLDFVFATIVLSNFAISFLVLRFTEPDAPDRDFIVPGGDVVAVLICIPYIFIMTATLGVNMTDWRLALGLVIALTVALLVYLYLFKNREGEIGEIGSAFLAVDEKEEANAAENSSANHHRVGGDDDVDDEADRQGRSSATGGDADENDALLRASVASSTSSAGGKHKVKNHKSKNTNTNNNNNHHNSTSESRKDAILGIDDSSAAGAIAAVANHAHNAAGSMANTTTTTTTTSAADRRVDSEGKNSTQAENGTEPIRHTHSQHSEGCEGVNGSINRRAGSSSSTVSSSSGGGGVRSGARRNAIDVSENLVHEH